MFININIILLHFVIMVTVEYLININFSCLSLEKIMGIKNKGRPTPNLNITQIKKTKSREF